MKKIRIYINRILHNHYEELAKVEKGNWDQIPLPCCGKTAFRGKGDSFFIS